MSKRFKIVLLFVVILIIDISYTATIEGYERYFRLGVISTYIEDKTCGAIGGKMVEIPHDCYSERQCSLSYEKYIDYPVGCNL